MANADCSVIIDTKMDTEGVEKGVKKVKDELGGAGESAEKANESIGGDLVSGFKKLGKAIGAAKIVEKLYEFGKEAIELGSDLEEVQNVVDVTFETMSDSVNKFAKDAQKSAGLSEKMAKQYVGTFGAMADSFGFTEAEAYEMSTALTQLTGDVASFYNLSQDEAATKLKGVFTGETEALKELGVVMTQAALDNYALANGFDKTTASMTEQEKVALRYQFVMDQLSAASGDFVRTQDSWANQSKVLSLQWESLMATLGTGLIDALSPGLSFLNEKMLPALQEGAEFLSEIMEPSESTKLRRELDSIASSVEDANEAFDDSAKAIDSAAIKAEIYKNMLKDLEEEGIETAESQEKYAHIVERLNEIYPELNLQINEQTGLLDDNSRAQLENLDAMKQRAMMAAVEKQYAELLQAQAAAKMAVKDSELALIDVQAERSALIAQITAETGLELDQLRELDVAQRKGEKTSIKLTTAQQAMLLTIALLGGEERRLTKEMEKGEKQVSDYEDEMDALCDAYGLTSDAAGEYAEDQGRLTAEQAKATSALAETNSKLEEMQAEYEAAKSAALSSIEAQVGAFDKLVVKSDQSAADIISNWESQRVAFDNYKENLEKAVEMGLDEALVKQLSDGSTESMAILNEFVNSTETSVDEINAAFRETQSSKDAVTTTMAEMASGVAAKMDSIVQEISSAWGDAESVVKRAMREMQSDIDGLKGKTVTVQILTNGKTTGAYSGNDMSLSNPSLGGYSLNTASVPYLASGAVIPPNAPFMAVLGDQRHGTNIEAPLSTIQEAVRNELGNQAVLNREAVDAINRLIATVEQIEIGDTVIGQAVDRYNRQNWIMNGGA